MRRLTRYRPPPAPQPSPLRPLSRLVFVRPQEMDYRVELFNKMVTVGRCRLTPG